MNIHTTSSQDILVCTGWTKKNKIRTAMTNTKTLCYIDGSASRVVSLEMLKYFEKIGDNKSAS